VQHALVHHSIKNIHLRLLAASGSVKPGSTVNALLEEPSNGEPAQNVQRFNAIFISKPLLDASNLSNYCLCDGPEAVATIKH